MITPTKCGLCGRAKHGVYYNNSLKSNVRMITVYLCSVCDGYEPAVEEEEPEGA